MSRRHEILDLLQDELDKYGLQGTVSDRSKHLELSWETPQGGRFVIVSKTASDWRSGLNARTELRKLLRKDDMQPVPVTSFQKALSLPKAPLVTQGDRDHALQKDVEVLTEIIFELQEQNTILRTQIVGLEQRMSSVTVVSRVQFGDAVAATQIEIPVRQKIEPKPFVRRNAVSIQELLLDKIPYEWTDIKDIMKDSPAKNEASTKSTVQVLRRRGMIEHGLRGLWRRVKHD